MPTDGTRVNRAPLRWPIGDRGPLARLAAAARGVEPRRGPGALAPAPWVFLRIRGTAEALYDWLDEA